MKKILCYGDSNTYGFIPQTGGRYDKTVRWSGVLSTILKDKFEILEEGMNNRTGFFNNSEGVKQSGNAYLPIFLQDHRDIDICILALGTNDSQIFYDLNEISAKAGIKSLVASIRSANQNTKVIIVPPVKITKNILNSNFSVMFDESSIEKILNVFDVFEIVAREEGCLYFDFNKFVEPSEVDGLHYNPKEHIIIAENLAKFICNNL